MKVSLTILVTDDSQDITIINFGQAVDRDYHKRGEQINMGE